MKKVSLLAGILALSGMVSLGIAEEQKATVAEPVKASAPASAEKPMKKKMAKTLNNC